MTTFIKGDPAAPVPDDGTTVVYDGAKGAYVPGPPPGSGTSGPGGTTDHAALTNRDAPNQHPISAITNLQIALDNKAEFGHQHTTAEISDATTTGRAVMQASSPTAARTAIGAGTSNLQLGTGPTTAAAGNHTHDDRYYTETEVDTALAGKASTSHTHPVADLTATGTPSATTFLRGDGAWATPAGGGGGGVDWAFPQVEPPSGGRIYFPPAGGIGGNSGINGNLYLTCLLAGYGSIVEVGVNIVTAPAGATSLRLGIYAPDTHGTRPLTLLADAGVIDATTTGFKVATLASAVPWAGGPLWVGVYRMTGAGGVPQSPSMGHVPIAHARDAHNWVSPIIGGGCYTTSQAYDAALPATLPGITGTFSPLHVGVKVQ